MEKVSEVVHDVLVGGCEVVDAVVEKVSEGVHNVVVDAVVVEVHDMAVFRGWGQLPLPQTFKKEIKEGENGGKREKDDRKRRKEGESSIT